jgi:hypothetical protein
VHNYTRDKVSGTMRLEGYGCSGGPESFRLPTKDAFAVFSLKLRCPDTLRTGNFLVALKASGQEFGTILVRNFPLTIPERTPVAVVTDKKNDIFLSIMDRFGIHNYIMRPDGITTQSLSGYSTVLLDCEQEGAIMRDSARCDALRKYMEAGGHIIEISQAGSAAASSIAPYPFGLSNRPPLNDSLRAGIEWTGPEKVNGNRLDSTGCSQWIYDFCHRTPAGFDTAKYSTVLRTTHGNIPLIISGEAGKGSYAYVALDLSNQLLSIDPTALKIFFNLLVTN